MRILTVGFNDEYVKELEKELDKYFICIVDNAKDMYDATNFTDFRHYELVVIVDEGLKFSVVSYVIYQHGEYPDLIAARVLANMRHLFGTQVNIDKLVIDIANKKIEYDEKIVSLNGKTFDILAYLALRKQRVFSKDEIINALWEEPEYVSDNTVEVAINQIRKRLKSILGFQVIHTVRRRGYKFSY